MQRALEVFLTGVRQDGDLSEDHGQFPGTFLHMENLSETSKNADIKGRAKKVSNNYTIEIFIQPFPVTLSVCLITLF